MAAVAPDSNSPSWLDAPMKMELTAATRPRMSSGVSSCVSVCRVTTLMLSAAPVKARASIDSHTDCDRPNTMVARPKAATDSSSRVPTWRCSGQRVSTSDIVSAPTAGEARSRPRPQASVCRMSRANMGSSAEAPPSSMAKRSSVVAPSSTLRWTTKRRPTSSSAQVALPLPGVKS